MELVLVLSIWVFGLMLVNFMTRVVLPGQTTAVFWGTDTMKLRSNGCRVRHRAFPSEAIMTFLFVLTSLLRLTLFPLARKCRFVRSATARTWFPVLASRIRLLTVNGGFRGSGAIAA